MNMSTLEVFLVVLGLGVSVLLFWRFVWFYLVRLCVPRKYLGVNENFHVNFDFDRRKNLISALMFMDGDIKLDELRKLVKEKTSKYAIFRERLIIGKWIWPYYESYKFNLDDHIYVSTLKGEGKWEDAEKEISRFHSIPMDMSKSLWRVLLVHYGNDKCFVQWSMHHCLADGFAGMQFFSTISEKGNRNEKEDWMNKKKKKKTYNVSLFTRIKMLFVGICKVLFLSVDDKRQFFRKKREIKPNETISYNQVEVPFKLDDLKRVMKKYGVSFNTAISSIMQSGLRSFLLKHGTSYDKRMLAKNKRYMKEGFWVNMRKISFAKQFQEMCNTVGYTMKESDFKCRIAGSFHKLATHVADDEKRIKLLHKEYNELIYSSEPMITHLVVKAVGFFPPVFSKVLMKLAYTASFSSSNVPGSQALRTLCGKKIRNVGFCSSPVGTMSTNIQICSYNKKVFFSFSSIRSYEKMKLLVQEVEKCFKEHMKLLEDK